MEFGGFKKQSDLNSLTLTPKQWIESTSAMGLISKAGRYGGTYAQKDIAFEFASWISVKFKLYLMKEFQRLKEHEFVQLGWDIRPNLAKVNYQIRRDAIKENLTLDRISDQQVNTVYASEVDMLNIASFGVTAQQWCNKNPTQSSNMRDHANMHQLMCLANLESMNAHYITEVLSQMKRLQKLNSLAIGQMTTLFRSTNNQLVL